MSVIRPGYWDPWDLGDDVFAWWNPDDYGSSLMTDDGSGRISSFKDRKRRINLTATTTARPTYGVTAFNASKKGLAYDGTANALRGTYLSLLPTGSTPCEVWQSVEFTAPFGTATIRFPFAMGGSAAGANKIATRYQNTTTPSFTVNNGSVSSTALGVFPKVLGVSFAGTDMSYRYDGKPGTSTTVVTKAVGTDRIAIGANNNNTVGNFWYGTVRQTLITKPLSDANRLRMEGWLAWDGGVQGVLP